MESKKVDERIRKRREKVKELYNQGKSQKETAQEVGFAIETINKDIKFLKEHGEITRLSIPDRREKVKELYNQGKSQKEILQEVGVGIETINKDIKFLKEQGEITRLSIPDRREKVKELYNQGKSTKDIKTELGVSHTTIYKDILSLSLKGEDEITRLSRLDRRNKVKELYNQGKSTKDINAELEISYATAYNDIVYLKKQGEIKEQKKDKASHSQIELTTTKIQRLYDDFYGQAKSLNKFKEYISDCKKRFKENNNNIELKELSTIGNVVSVTEKYEDIVFYLNLCIKFGEIEKAMKFANSQMQNETLTKEEQGKIRSLKNQMEEINRKNIAIRMLKNGEGIEQAVKYSRLSQIEVIELNRKLLQQKKEQQHRKEKEDVEEQNR